MKNEPFKLIPACKDYLWGGERLKDEYGKVSKLSPLAETWECSTHPDGPSIVAGGTFEGKTLTEVLKNHPEYLGTHPDTDGKLPILIKFIDAKQDLSIQVHPTDEYAARKENGQRGKTEMWYVLDAEKDARLVYGLKEKTDADTLRKAIGEGRLEDYMQSVPVRENDLFYIEAGTIHAIGAGVLVAEIQQNSNLTYRLYDYERVDKYGRKRELHVEKALEVADLSGNARPRQPMRVLRYTRGSASELLCRCKYFEVHRFLVNTELPRDLVRFQSDELSFRVLLCTGGCGTISYECMETGMPVKKTLPFFKGDCLFVPAESVEMTILGNARFLDVRG